MLIPKHVFESYRGAKSREAPANLKPVGTGAYRFVDFLQKTGQKLWEARLPAGGQATPMSFVSDKTGKQYVVVMAGGHGSLGTKMGDSLVAYALPDNSAPHDGRR